MTKQRALGFLVTACMTGCGIFGSDSEEAPLPEKQRPIDGAPQIDVRDDAGFFVSPEGKDDGDGSRGRPFATITRGIYEAKMTQKSVFVCQGTFKEDIVLVDGVSVLGGLDCSRPEWPKSNAKTRIEPPRSPAMQANGVTTPTRVEGFEVIAPDAAQPSTSSISLFLQDSPGLTFVESRFVAGNGAKGTDGLEPPATIVGGTIDGEAGATPKEVCTNIAVACEPWPQAVGGTVTCNGNTNDAMRGGAGGRPGLYESNSQPSGWTYVPRNFDAKFNPTSGEDKLGAAGEKGTDGKSAAGYGDFSRAGYQAANGTAGTSGFVGAGGDGGNGLPHQICAYCGEDGHKAFRSWGGAGGGAGGCQGIAGTAGHGGGASIGVFAVGSAIRFVAVEIVTGVGGAGGRGTFGSQATRGGKPGASTYAGQAGQAGGNGGPAGTSGSGAGGPSIGIAFSGTQPAMIDSRFSIGKGGAGVPLLTRNNDVGGTSTILPSGDGPSGETVGF